MEQIGSILFICYYFSISLIPFLKSSTNISASSRFSPFTPMYNFIFGSVPDGLIHPQKSFSNSKYITFDFGKSSLYVSPVMQSLILPFE